MIAVRVLIAGLLLAAAACAAPALRIVSTSPGVTEILFALGLGDRVVGVTDYCRYPAEAQKKPKIGSWAQPNMEVILAQRPDLVIVQQTAVHSASKFRSAGLRTLPVKLEGVPTIHAAIDSIGDAAGVPDRARKLNAEIRGGLADVQKRLTGVKPEPVLFVVGRDQGALSGVIAAGPGSHLDEIIRMAGGRNVLADSPVPYAKVSREEILARRPEVILDVGEYMAGAPGQKQQAEVRALWAQFATLPAVRDNRVHVLDNNLFVIPGPRIAECARQVARLLHPERFR